MTSIDLQSRPVVPEDVIFRDVVGEAVILHLGTGIYFGLDPVGTRAWQLINECAGDLAAVSTMLAAEYDAPEDQIRGDLLALVQQLVARDLLRITA